MDMTQEQNVEVGHQMEEEGNNKQQVSAYTQTKNNKSLLTHKQQVCLHTNNKSAYTQTTSLLTHKQGRCSHAQCPISVGSVYISLISR